MLPYGHISNIWIHSLPLHRILNMNEVLDLLGETGNNDIYMEPPEPHQLTDEDSADSGDEATYMPSTLCGNQLRAPAELGRKKGKQLSPDLNDVDDAEDDIPLVHLSKVVHSFKWTSSKVEVRPPIFPESNLSKYRNYTPREFFDLFFDEEVCNHIVTQSNLYALQKNLSSLNLGVHELRVFLSILIVSGYNSTSSKGAYWSDGDDLRNQAIYNAMRRNRFDQIMRALHLQDNLELDCKDRFSKVRPLIIFMQRRFMENYMPSPSVSNDEAMVEYFGKHGCKQSIRNKPTRFGYKIWCQNSPSGYLITFEPYQGKFSTIDSTDAANKFGKCAATVLQLLNQYSTNTNTECSKCDVGLCVPCFIPYHTK